MPIITFSEKDILRSKIVTPAWYRVMIDSTGEKPSKDGGSTNYPIEGTILGNADNGDKEFASVPLTWNFNSKVQGFMIGFLAAFGVEVKSEQRIELDSASGKEIDVFVENDTWNGNLINRVNHKYRVPREG